jgi:hypothetical protein
MANCVVAFKVLVAVSNPMPHCLASAKASMLDLHGDDCAKEIEHDNSAGWT